MAQDDRKPGRFNHVFLLLAGTLSASVIIVAFGTRLLAIHRADAEQIARNQTGNLAHSIDQNITATMDRIDLTLGTVAAQVENSLAAGQLDLERTRQFLADEERLLPEAEGIWVTDAQGRVIISDFKGLQPTSLADRPYFAVLRDLPDAGIVISKPLVGRITRKEILVCARRCSLLNGRFAGMVVVPVTLDHFRSLLSGYDVGPNGVLTIRDSDGGMVARKSNQAEEAAQPAGSRLISSELDALLHSGVEEAAYSTQTPTDRLRRLYAYRRIKGFPLLVLAGMAETDYLAQWRRGRAWTFEAMGFSLLGLWTLTGLLWKSLSRHERDTAALLATQERFRTQFELASEGICIVSPEGRLREVNEAFARMHGRSRRELEDMGLEDLLRPGSRSQIASWLRELLGGKVLTFEVEQRHKDGHWFLLEVSASAVFSTGPATILAFCRDLTGRKREEAERRKLDERVNRVQSLEALGVLVAGVAHNLNNVLAVILGTATLHSPSTTEASALDDFRIIATACGHGRSVIKSLLQFARPTLACRAPLDLHTIIREVTVLLENTTRNRIEIITSFTEEPLWIDGDAGNISHALMNICLNALGAMPDRGTLVLGTAAPAPDEAEVSIQDNGAGMTPEILAHVFEPFFTTKAVDKGTGLGLSMTYGVVKAHGGTIDIASQPGQGTCVKLRFPRIPPPAPGPIADTPGPSLGGMEVLLVDDDEDVRVLMTRLLMKAGALQVKTAARGEEALALLGPEALPGLVILDQNMPGWSGVETMQRIRSRYPDLPILISSGQPDIENWSEFRQAKVGVISKPFTLEEIQARLAPLVQGPAADLTID